MENVAGTFLHQGDFQAQHDDDGRRSGCFVKEGVIMADGVEMKGRVARIMEGAGGVEIKATIPERQVDAALKAYNLAPSENERYIYFFDTPQLELFELGVIGRARRIVGGQHDSTIKFRPVDPATVPTLWRNYRGFKIEADACDKGVVKSASLTMPVAKGLIKRVVAGDNPISDLFTEQQVLFLLSMSSKKIDYSRAIVMGPMRVWRWKHVHEGLPWPITGELWQREDGARIFEVSIKTPVIQAAAASAGFMAFLAEIGAERDEGQQAKTRWALEHWAKREPVSPTDEH
jgi:hypothetical protein